MGHEIVYCSRCQSRLTSSDFEKGSGVRLSNYVYCATCLTDEEKAGLAKAARSMVSGPRISTVTPRSFPAASGTARSVRGPAPSKRTPILIAVVGGGALLVVGLLLMSGGGSRRSEPVEAPDRPTPSATPPPVARPAPDFKRELDGLRSELAGPVSQNSFKFAQALLDRAREAHTEAAWTEGLQKLDEHLQERARARVKELEAGDPRDGRAEIARWGPGFQPMLRDFEKKFETALAAQPPPPVEPVKPPPVPVEPVMTEAAKKYLEAWKKAMEAAGRRDFARAKSDLRAAAGEEQAADLKNLEKLEALWPELLKVPASLRAWEEVAIEVVQEDGSRLAVRGSVVQAGPRRLELRGEPRFVEIEDIAPSSLARLYKKKHKLVAGQPTSLALLCAIDGDAAAAAEFGGTSSKLQDLAAQPRTPSEDPARRKEWAAKRLYYDAEKEFRSMETRGAALEKFGRLLSELAETEFVKTCRVDVNTRIEETRDYVLGAGRMTGKGVFTAQKVAVVAGKDKVEMTGWRTREDPPADDSGTFVEVSFFAPAGVEYKAWALVGGCCASTFTWYLQSNELVYTDRKTRKTLGCDPGGKYAAPWEHRLKSLSTTHGGKGHAKAEKEPTIWEWLELPNAKYSVAGPKTIRFMAESKGQAVAAVIVSANRDKRPGIEEIRKVAEMVADEAVLTSALRLGKGEPDLLAQIPEAKNYVLVYDLDLAKVRKPAVYDVDRHTETTKPFDRIAYALELQKKDGPMQYVFVSMDAFTEDAGKVGIPDVATGASFQKMVTGLNVHCNVEGVPTGINLEGGNIEFWPNNYGPWNSKSVPGASNETYDFGDTMSQPVDGHGTMQVHHHKSGQTIFALNKWSAGNNAELGIGTNKSGNPDYTFAGNGGSYSYKRLRVLVRPKG